MSGITDYTLSWIGPVIRNEETKTLQIPVLQSGVQIFTCNVDIVGTVEPASSLSSIYVTGYLFYCLGFGYLGHIVRCFLLS